MWLTIIGIWAEIPPHKLDTAQYLDFILPEDFETPYHV